MQFTEDRNVMIVGDISYVTPSLKEKLHTKFKVTLDINELLTPSNVIFSKSSSTEDIFNCVLQFYLFRYCTDKLFREILDYLKSEKCTIYSYDFNVNPGEVPWWSVTLNEAGEFVGYNIIGVILMNL